MRPEQLARIKAISPFAIAACTVLLCALSTALSAMLVFRAYHGVILWDQWDTLYFYDSLRDGTATFADFIRQHNEHRLLFPRLIFALDLALTGARNTVNLAAIPICQALHVLLFHRMITLGTPDRAMRWGLTALVALLLFSLVQKENFVWGFQIQFVGVFLFYSLAAFMLAAAQEPAGGRRWALLAGGFFFGAGAALVMSNGVAALVCIAFVFAAARLHNRLTAAIALLGIAVSVLYAATFTPNPGHTPLGFALRHPVIFIQYVSVYLGGVLAPLGLKVAFAAGMAGLALLGAALLGLFTGRLARNRTNLTLTAILVFIAATAAMTALGRSSFGVAQAASSRYATPSAIFWAAATTLGVLFLLDRTRGRRLGALGLLFGAALLFAFSTALVQRDYRYEGRIRVVDMSRASDAILSEVYDKSALQVVFPDVELMKSRMLPIMRKHRLNVLAAPQPWPLGSEVPQARIVDDRCRGAIDLVEPIEGIAAAFQLKGWAWDTVARRAPGRLIALSRERRVLGFGSSGALRGDVPPQFPGVSGIWTGWTAFAREVAGPVGIYGLLEDGALCRVAATP